MTTWNSDWVFLENAVDSLKDYLLSEQLFWPLYSGKHLTIGNLRLAQRKLSVIPLPDDIQAKTNENEGRIEKTFIQWRSNWSAKAEQEFKARFRQWEHFLREVSSNKTNHGLTYSHEVITRVLLELLKDELLAPLDQEYLLLQQFDTRLKAVLKSGEFIWHQEFMPGFPETTFWFLYAQLKN